MVVTFRHYPVISPKKGYTVWTRYRLLNLPRLDGDSIRKSVQVEVQASSGGYVWVPVSLSDAARDFVLDVLNRCELCVLERSVDLGVLDFEGTIPAPQYL